MTVSATKGIGELTAKRRSSVTEVTKKQTFRQENETRNYINNLEIINNKIIRSRSRERNSKNVGRKDIGDTYRGGGIGNNTTEVKRKRENHRCGHIS